MGCLVFKSIHATVTFNRLPIFNSKYINYYLLKIKELEGMSGIVQEHINVETGFPVIKPFLKEHSLDVFKKISYRRLSVGHYVICYSWIQNKDCIWNKYLGYQHWKGGRMELLVDLNMHLRVLCVAYHALQHFIFFEL